MTCHSVDHRDSLMVLTCQCSISKCICALILSLSMTLCKCTRKLITIITRTSVVSTVVHLLQCAIQACCNLPLMLTYEQRTRTDMRYILVYIIPIPWMQFQTSIKEASSFIALSVIIFRYILMAWCQKTNMNGHETI